MRFESRVAPRRFGARMKARRHWRSFAQRVNARGPRRVARACAALDSKRRGWIEIGLNVRGASSRHLRHAGNRFAGAARGARAKCNFAGLAWKVRSPIRPPLAPAQRRTLDIGSWVVLSGVGFGYQLGGWPAWTVLAGIGSYAIWVVLYAEITIQRSRGRGRYEALSAPMPNPEPEESAA